MKKIFYILIFNTIIYTQCSPIEVALHMSNADGWMFPFSAFYNGISNAYSEIYITNPECYELLENNHECISDCLYMEQNEVDQYLGRVGCLYYTCPDGELLVHNYDELNERPFHTYGQYYCAEGTQWSEELDSCQPDTCNGDLNNDSLQNVQDIVIMVNNILNGESNCE